MSRRAGLNASARAAPRWRRILNLLTRKYTSAAERAVIAEFQRLAVVCAEPNKRGLTPDELTAERFAELAHSALEDDSFRRVLESYPMSEAGLRGHHFALRLGWLRGGENPTWPDQLRKLQEHHRKLVTLRAEAESFANARLSRAYSKAHGALTHEMGVAEKLAKFEKMIYRPSLYGKRGRARAREGAKRGYTVRLIAECVPVNIKNRYVIIARLAKRFAGEEMSRQLVRGILLAGRT